MIGSKISRRYAKALLSLGQEDGRYQDYGQNLNEFERFCSANSEFFQTVCNQLFPVESRKKILEIVLERSSLSEVVKNFLRLLLEKNRLAAIGGIAEYYTRLTDEISNITRAGIITAKPLKKKAMDKLEHALRNLTSKEVKMTVEEDEFIIGGLIVKIGDTVLDGSVRAQLRALKESLKRGEYN